MNTNTQLNESKIDLSRLYFHGSSESKVNSLEAPSFEHPFYVTTDLHYAMAFCTKDSSQTGEYSIKKNFTPSSQNYVYVVTLKPGCKVFDFRDHNSSEFQKIYKIVDKDLVDWVESYDTKNFDFNDIYEFVAALENAAIKPVDVSNSSYLEYCKLYANADKQMSPKLFLKACSFARKNGLSGASQHADIHEIMAPILKGLYKLGFQGVLTQEYDFNDEPSGASAKVSTKHAIGIFDKDALDLLSLVPMKYEWLKKVNPSYLQDKTDESAYKKIKRFISLYKKLASHIDESTRSNIQLVNDVPEDQFKKVMSNAKVLSKHFKHVQFEKLYGQDYKWSMLLDNGQCVAAAALLEEFGPERGMTYINELQSLVPGNGYGKKLLLKLKDSYDGIWLMADASVKSDALVNFYRDPAFKFVEKVLPASESIYEVDTHVFVPKSCKTSDQAWHKFFKAYFGKQN